MGKAIILEIVASLWSEGIKIRLTRRKQSEKIIADRLVGRYGLDGERAKEQAEAIVKDCPRKFATV